MILDEAVINRGIVFGASMILFGYYTLIQGYYEVNSFITVLWGIINMVLVYQLIGKYNECKKVKKNNIVEDS